MRSRIALLSALCACVAVVGGAAAETAASVQGVVISEFRVRGPNGAADEFVELYNTTGADVAIGGWLVRGSNNAGTVSTRATIPATTMLPAGCHYLLANSSLTGGPYSGAVPGDQTYTTGITDDGGIALTLADTTTVVDQVGMSATSAYKEGTTLASLGANNLDRGYERKPGGALGSGQDTDDNSADFSLVTPSNPQNKLSTCVSTGSTDPSGTGAASPSTVVAGDSSLLTVAVTPGTNPTSTGLAVTADLTQIGGSATQQLFDDATNGDVTAGDNTFSYQATVPAATTPGAKTLAASITDAQARAGSASIGLTVTAAGPGPGDVTISEVYGGGGNAGASYKNDFVELFNRTASPISLAGWSVQYGSATGTTWQVTSLSGSIAAGGYYLVQEGAGANGDLSLPAPNATGGIAMSGTAGKIALVSSTTAITSCPSGGAIIDFVGYGPTANCSETSPAPLLSNTTSAHRSGGGVTDTNNNGADFTAGVPDPRGATNPAPTVTTTIPANGASDVGLSANLVVTFSEPVSVSGSWFTIACGTSGAHSATFSATSTLTPGNYRFTIDPSSDFAANESCTVTIVGAQVADRGVAADTMAADHVFSFTTTDPSVCGDPATSIHTVQGSAAASPIAGASVSIEGIVVGDYQDTVSEFGGYYLQEEDGQVDANADTSEGVFVFANGFGAAVNPGDLVRAHGTVSEFNGLTEVGNVNAVQVCSTGNALPAATPVSLPVARIDDLERTEGMLVNFDQTLTATEVFNLGRFGEVSLSGVGRLYSPSAVVLPGAPAEAKRDENNRSRIILDDGNGLQDIDPTRYPQGGLSASNTLRVGDTLPGLTGVMDFRFANYRIQPIGPLTWIHSNPRTAAPDAVGGNLRIASFNVLNYFNGNGTHQEGAAGGFPTSRGANSLVELDRQTAKEVSALTAMNADIVGLMEMENDSGPNSAIADLVSALNAATAPGTYTYVDTGVIGTDEIKVALIYKPSAVTPVGDWKILTSAIDPRFIDTRNRPSLAQTFQKLSNGEKLTVVVNHLKSKGSGCGAGDDISDASGGNCNGTRTMAAEALVDWLATDPTGSGDPDFLLIGDMNSYAMESPIQAFEAGGLTNLVRKLHGLTAYSYVFNGESGYLDHALATSSLEAQVAGVTDWHINPDEPTVLDYNVEFKTPNHVNTLYDSGPYRASDHDPVVIGLNLSGTAPTATFNAPASAFAGIAFTISLTSPHGAGATDTFTYAFDCGTGYGAFGAASSASCTTTTTGPLTVHGTIKDDDGDFTEYTRTVTVVVTFDSLCTLTRSYVSSADVADSLCAQLAVAKAANARGDSKGKERALKAYVKLLNAQAGKSITRARADVLIGLASEL